MPLFLNNERTTPPLRTHAGSSGGGGGSITHGRDVNGTNTGYQNAPGYPGSLTALSGPFITSNQTYSFRDIGQTTVGQDGGATPTNVEFYGCRFRTTDNTGAMLRLYGTNIRFRYCTFMPAAVSAPPVSYAQAYEYGVLGSGAFNSSVGQLLIEYSEFFGGHDYVLLAPFTGNPTRTIQYNYMHDSADTGGVAHVDFVGHVDNNGSWSNLVLRGNNMQGNANSSILGLQYGNYSNFTIEDNVFGGGGYTVNMQGTGTNNSFQRNDLNTTVRPVFGPLQGGINWNSANGNVWRNNRWKVPGGAAWGTPGNDGKYWIPDASDASALGYSDSSFVSTTDYTG